MWIIIQYNLVFWNILLLSIIYGSGKLWDLFDSVKYILSINITNKVFPQLCYLHFHQLEGVGRF